MNGASQQCIMPVTKAGAIIQLLLIDNCNNRASIVAAEFSCMFIYCCTTVTIIFPFTFPVAKYLNASAVSLSV